MLIGGEVTKKRRQNGKKSDWERRNEKNRRGKMEGGGIERRTGHCRENLSRGKTNRRQWEKSRRVKRRERCGSGKVRGNEG